MNSHGLLMGRVVNPLLTLFFSSKLLALPLKYSQGKEIK